MTIQLGVSLLCALLAGLHLAMWQMARHDELQLRLAIALGGAALFSLSLAGSTGEMGSSRPWLALGVLANLPGWLGYAGAVWSFARLPITRARWIVLAAIAAVWLVVAIEHARFLIAASGSPTWDDMIRGDAVSVGPAIGALLCGMPLVEAARLARHRRFEALALAIAALASVAIVVVDLAGARLGGVTVIGMTGLPVIGMASASVLLRFRQVLAREQHAGDYRLVRRLGVGGMGELFLAVRHGAGGFRRPVALKRILSRQDPAAIERLLVEARTAAALAHPNIVAVHDVGLLDHISAPRALVDHHDFGWYVAMELLVGVDASRLHAPVPPELAVAIGEGVARGLAYAHARGVVHRDVSPHNVVVTFDGEIKLVDFGIAVASGTDEPANYIAGKPGYIAPERYAGEPAGPAADQYGLGVTLYELLAGTRPNAGSNTLELATAALLGEHAPLHVAAPIAAIVERMLAPDPAKRYPDLDAVAAALHDVATPVDIGAYLRRYHADAEHALDEETAPESPTAPREATPPTKRQ